MKRFTFEKLILFLAASFAAYNFGLAGGYIEGRGGQISIGGLIAGAVVNLTLAVAASRYGSLTGRNRTRQATIAFLAMLMIAPLIVSPAIYYSLPVTFLAHPLLRAFWSVGWASGPDLAIVLAGAVSGKGLVHLGEPQPTVRPAQSAPSAAAVRRQASAVREQEAARASALRSQAAELVAQYACTQCDWKPSAEALIAAAEAGRNPKIAAASAKAGHVKNNHVRIPVDPALLINKD